MRGSFRPLLLAPCAFVVSAALGGACSLDSMGTGPLATPASGSAATGGSGGAGGEGGRDATTSTAASGGAGGQGHGGAGGAGGSEPVCGNGALEATEECDDENLVAGDGCSPTCTVEEPVLGCPGQAVTVDIGQVTFAGSTQGGGNTSIGSCGGGSAPAAFFAVTPNATGTLTAKVAALYAKPVVYARATCDAGPELACDGSDTPSVSLIVKAGVPVTIVVDGSAGTEGAFNLSLSLSVCGNGLLDGSEVCDDGNTTPGDGCEGCAVTCACEGCSGVVEWKNTDDHCYRLVYGDDRSWSGARTECQLWGGDLVGFSSTTELDTVKGVVIAPGDDDVWIGGTDTGDEGEFYWINGEPFVFGSGGSPWATFEPNDLLFGEDCVEAYDDGKLNDEVCSKSQDYLCERLPVVGPPP